MLFTLNQVSLKKDDISILIENITIYRHSEQIFEKRFKKNMPDNLTDLLNNTKIQKDSVIGWYLVNNYNMVTLCIQVQIIFLK